jgi:hypothetical protein
MMKKSYWATGIMATFFSLGCLAASQAQVINPDSQQTTSMSMTAPTAAAPLEGQAQTVSYDKKFLWMNFGKHIAKAIAIEPGAGQISLDGLAPRNTVDLTLINPSATPLQFETTEHRSKQVVAVVPPHSQQVFTFSGARGDVKFFVMQQPQNAVAINQDYVTQQTAAVARTQQEATRADLDRQTAQIKSNQEQAIQEAMDRQAVLNREAANRTEGHRTEGRSAVRGYW